MRSKYISKLILLSAIIIISNINVFSQDEDSIKTIEMKEVMVSANKTEKPFVEFPTILELWKQKIAVVRSIFVGFFCGILPGIGATLAAFMGYGEAKT